MAPTSPSRSRAAGSSAFRLPRSAGRSSLGTMGPRPRTMSSFRPPCLPGWHRSPLPRPVRWGPRSGARSAISGRTGGCGSRSSCTSGPARAASCGASPRSAHRTNRRSPATTTPPWPPLRSAVPPPHPTPSSRPTSSSTSPPMQPDPIEKGHALRYSLTITNAGTAVAHHVIVTDHLPPAWSPSTSFRSWTAGAALRSVRPKGERRSRSFASERRSTLAPARRGRSTSGSTPTARADRCATASPFRRGTNRHPPRRTTPPHMWIPSGVRRRSP